MPNPNNPLKSPKKQQSVSRLIGIWRKHAEWIKKQVPWPCPWKFFFFWLVISEVAPKRSPRSWESRRWPSERILESSISFHYFPFVHWSIVHFNFLMKPVSRGCKCPAEEEQGTDEEKTHSTTFIFPNLHTLLPFHFQFDLGMETETPNPHASSYCTGISFWLSTLTLLTK